MVIEVMDIHAVNDSAFSENETQIFTCQPLQRSRIFHHEHGEGINFTSVEGIRNWFGDSKKTVSTVKSGMFTSCDSRGCSPAVHTRTSADVADAMVVIVCWNSIGSENALHGMAGRRKGVSNP